MTRRNRRSAANDGANASQTIGLAGDHKTRGFLSHADGLGSISSYALSQPNSIVAPLGGRDIPVPDRGGQRANVPATSALSKPLRIAEVSQPPKKDVVAKIPIRQSTQHLRRMDPPVAQVKITPELGKKANKKAGKKAGKKAAKEMEKKAEKKKRKPFYKEVKKEVREPAYWKEEAEEDARLLIIAQETRREEVGIKAAEHRQRRDPHVNGLGSVSSYALSQPNTIVTSLSGRAIPDRGGKQTNVPVTSAWSKPLRIAEVSQPSKKDVVMKMPIRQSTQHLRRTDPPVAQVKPASESGKKAGKKKRKPFYKEMKKEIRGPSYWNKKAAEDARLMIIAQGIWREKVEKKAAAYRRRRAAKKCRERCLVSQKWMTKKEGMNRKARHTKQNQRQRFVRLNKSYANKLRVGYFPKNITPVHHRRPLGRREKSILRSKVEESNHTLQIEHMEKGEIKTRACPARKEAKKARRANGRNAGRGAEDKNTL